MKYPEDCPVFDIDGQHVESRPICHPHDDDGVCYRLTPIDDEGYATWMRGEECMRPLTRAARELLAWSRQ
jgi:hypothetical protein